jgi:hypothetical protein
MTISEYNPEACRILDRIAALLRELVRNGLRILHADNWEKAGIPTVLDYAGFVDLFDIIVTTPELLSSFIQMGLDEQVLRMRFLDLETIRNRIAYSRPVSSAEANSLAAFEDRLQAVSRAAAGASNAGAPSDAPAPPRASPVADHPVAATPRVPAAPQTAPKAPSPAPPSQPVRPQGPPAVSLPEFEAALSRFEDGPVLAALYHEITELADKMWNGALAPPGSRLWERVRESRWYAERFSKLGLKVVSDFYGLAEGVCEMGGRGAGKVEVQGYLRDHGFAQLLLALRDFFSRIIK